MFHVNMKTPTIPLLIKCLSCTCSLILALEVAKCLTEFSRISRTSFLWPTFVIFHSDYCLFSLVETGPLSSSLGSLECTVIPVSQVLTPCVQATTLEHYHECAPPHPAFPSLSSPLLHLFFSWDLIETLSKHTDNN